MSSELTQSDMLDDTFQDDLKPGTKLLRGQYVIEQFLNNGGFGITYLARDSLNRLVVIKECFPESLCSRKNSTVRVRSRHQTDTFRTMVDLFIEEARNLARLSHPNIVGVHQVFEDNDTAYMAIDFVDGRDLLEIVESSNAFRPEALEAIVVKLLDAIEFIHHEGILHRDIAPDNILLSKDNEPVLIDFGAARETVSRATRLLGTMRTVKDGYSPHEFYVADADQFPSSDLYSLAASLYHVMTKELPANAQERLAAIAGGDPDPYVSIKTLATGYSEPFLDAIDRALEVFPKNRIQSAAEWRGLITHTRVTTETRGTVSRPVLAIDNENPGAATDPFDGQTPAPVGRRSKGLPMRKVRPVSNPGPTSKVESVFLDDEPPAVAPSPKKVGNGRGIYMGAAAVALLIGAGFGVYSLTGSDGASDETPEIVANTSDATTEAAPDSTVTAEATSNADTPVIASNDATSSQTPAVERPAWMDIPTNPVVQPTPVETEQASQPPAEETASVAEETPEVENTPVVEDTRVIEETAEETSDIQEASSVIVGKSIRLQATADAQDPTLVSAVEGPVAEVLQPGQRVVSVNGYPLESLNDFHRVVDATTDYSAGDSVDVTLGIEDPQTGATVVETVELPAVQQTMLLNGVSFETVRDGESWSTVVTAGNGVGESDLQAGDRIVAFMPTNELMDQEASLATVLSRELEAGATQFNFAVERGGDMWVVSMRYAARALN